MYKLKRIWLEFRSHMGKYIYVWLMFTVIIYIFTPEIMALENEYYTEHFVKDYNKDMYLYANVAEKIYETTTSDEIVGENMEAFIAEIEQVSGVKGLGYYNNIGRYDIGYSEEDVRLLYINDIMSDISYNRIYGQWLTEAEYSDDYVNVVVGSAIGEIYGIGENFTLESSENNKSYTCKVVGIFYQSVGPIYLNMAGSDKRLNTVYDGDWNIYTNDSRVMKGIESSEYSYPSTNLLIALEEDYDADKLLKYGNIYSFDELENANDEYYAFIFYDILQTYGVLIFVVLFGSFSVIYLIISKGMYTTGVYSLLGQTKKSKVVENMIIHILVYIIAVVTAYCVYINNVDEYFIDMYNGRLWTSWNNIFVVVLGIITTIITVITSICMIGKRPKDIMIAARNMEG